MITMVRQHIWIIVLYASHQMVVVSTTNAQFLYYVKNDSVSIIDTTKASPSSVFNQSDSITVKKSEAKPTAKVANVTYKNGIKIVGVPTFGVEINNGQLTVTGVLVEGDRGHLATMTSKGQAEAIPNGCSTKDIRQIIYANVGKRGSGAFLFFDDRITLVVPDEKSNTMNGSMVGVSDSSKIFTHDGAIYTSSDGSIAASTPTTLLVITPNDVLGATYESLFGKIPPFKKPTISGGRNPDEVFIRDETMVDATGAVRLDLDLKTLELKVANDDK
jgi:hypothetical protein